MINLRNDTQPVVPVYHYAITFPQLIAQAKEIQLEDDDMARLRAGYDLAERMFDGLYRSQGSAFINHLVRSASIVMAHGGSIPTVLAAMFHSAYMLDCFTRSRRRGYKPDDRAILAGTIGPDAEEIAWEYARLKWGKREAVEEHMKNLNTYSPVIKSVLVVRLANELEDFLDLAMLYRPNYNYRNRIAAIGEACIVMADNLDMPGLGQDIKKAFEVTLAGKVPDAMVRSHINAYELPRQHYHEKNVIDHTLSRIVRGLKRWISNSGNAQEKTRTGKGNR